MKLEFGYWPKELFANGPDWSIATLPSMNGDIAYISNHPSVRNRWIYPTYGVALPSYGPPSRRFHLPNTHEFSHRNSDPNHAKFLIWVLSFLFGMRLSSERYAYIDAASVEAGMLVDFLPVKSVEKAVELGENFWRRTAADPIQRKRFCAAVHALFLAHGPQLLQFEKFIYHYSALDALYRILHPLTPDVPHQRRIEWMCGEIRIPIPVWARVDPLGKRTEISSLRNDTIHEAIYAGEPLGFAIDEKTDERNLSVELGNLTCRILAHILKVPDRAYIEMPTDIYGRHDLNL